MALNPEEVAEFWARHAARHKDDDGPGNFERDPALRVERLALEDARIAEVVGGAAEGARVLDLGGGTGFWAFRFAAVARDVEVVDFSAELVAAGARRAQELGAAHVRFVHSAAQLHVRREPVDLVFISGLLIYLNDDDLDLLLGNLAAASHPGTVIVLRDGTAVGSRYEITGKWSEALEANYHALYRTRDEYVAAFARAGFAVERDEDVFPEGSPFNKFPETRLRIYRFVARSG